jgi:chromosome segregation ATPase
MHIQTIGRFQHWVSGIFLLAALFILSGCCSKDMAKNAAHEEAKTVMDSLATNVNQTVRANFAEISRKLDNHKSTAETVIKVSDDERRTFGLAISNLVTRADAILTLQSNYLQLQTNLAGLKAAVETLTGSNNVLRSQVEQLYTRYQISTNQIAKLEGKADDVEKERKRQWEDSLKLTARLEQVRASELRNQDWHRQLSERERQLQVREQQLQEREKKNKSDASATTSGSPASGQGKGIPPKTKPSK